MEIRKVLASQDRCVVKLCGRLDLQGVGEIEDEFRQYYTDFAGELVVDMSDVAFLASLGMRMLMMAAKSLNVSGGKIIVAEPQEVVENALRISGLDQVIDIVDSVDTE